MALPEHYRLLSPFCVEREIGDTTFTFYPNSVKVAARLSDVIADLSSHVSVLLSSTERDQGSVHEEVKDADGMSVVKTSVQPINPELAMKRVNKRAEAVKAAVENLTSSKNLMVIGELLMDSLRDDFPRSKRQKTEDVQALVDGMDVPVLLEFIKGLVAANAKIFGDLGNSLKGLLGEKVGSLLGDLVPVAPVVAGQTSSEPSSD